LQIKHLNLDIPPPDEVSVSPSTTPNQGQSVVFSWTSPQETATFFLSDITEYEISVKKNFSNGSSVADPSGDRQEKNDRSFSIDGDQNLKSVLFQVRTCTDEGCGAPASELITFTPDGISAALDPIPLVRGIPTVISWTANAIADTYEIELDEKDDVVASSAVITAPNLEWTYEYEPNTNHVRIHVRPCNGAVCGEYLSSPRLTYQEYIGIISGTGQTEVSTGSAFSRVITLNKSSNYTYSFSPARPAWLSAIHSGSTITLSGTPQLADAGTFSSTITVNYTEAPVSSATGSIIVVVNSTCGDGIVQLSIGEQCDPNSTATPMPNQNAIANYTINGVIADNSITKRCVPAGQTIGGRTECNWWPDADSDGIDGQTDCQNHVNDPNMFIGSTHQGTASGDYNCSGVIDSDLSCSAYDYQDLRTNWGSHPSAAGEHNSCETPCTAPGEEYCIASYASMTSACDTFDGTYDYSPAPGGACSGSNRGSPPGPSGYGWEYGLLCRACTASQTLYW